MLEHLPNPAATLAALAAALRPGGTLYIHLPGAPGPNHPMHLWHQPGLLLRHLRGAGLWLERHDASLGQGGGSTLVLRRGEGPRYQLNRGLELLADEQGGVVLSRRPLVALRLNLQAFGLLAGLDGGSTALDLVADQRALPLNTATSFLDGLAQRRLLLRRPPPPAAWPSASIIVPAHGRPAATRACVESLLALDYPAGRPEVIVVDDASDPPLAPALAGLPVRTIRHEVNHGQSAARNHAAALASGEVLAFIDNDCVAAPGWLRSLVAALDEPGVELAGGRVMAPPPSGPVAAFEAVRSPLDMGPVSGVVGPGEPISYMPSCNLAVRRDLLLRIGGFDPAMTLGEDVDLIWRALRAGAGARYLAEGQVIHHHRVRLGALLRRRADYASSEADLQRRHPEGRRTMVLPGVTVLLLAALVVAGSAWPLSLLLCAWALGRLAHEIWQKQRDLGRNGVRLPTRQVIGAVLHAHRAALYHLGANVTRYYSLPLLAAALLWPHLLSAAAILLLTPPAIDYYRLRPRLSLPLFTGLYWLELTAYQLGVWAGCWRWRTLRPLLPALRLGR
ncbi:MAG: mycofactocin system glycosyltransferase [Chloroflexales bacterium]|nr:mycofactocin system glycosyltransferase [Chloroflexales bacterium]